MVPFRSKKYILIVTDSRGSWLNREIQRYQTHLLKFKVIYRRGAGLAVLWEIIEWNLLSRRVDYVFILGGVCDLTDRYLVNGRRSHWLPEDIDGRFNMVYRLLRDISSNFRLLNTGAKLIFLPEPGLDLIRWNRISHPVPWRFLVEQAELQERLELLQLYTKVINSHLGSITPWSLDITHSFRNGELHPVYDRMRDGLHFSGMQVKKLAQILACYVEDDLMKSGYLSISMLNIYPILPTPSESHGYLICDEISFPSNHTVPSSDATNSPFQMSYCPLTCNGPITRHWSIDSEDAPERLSHKERLILPDVSFITGTVELMKYATKLISCIYATPRPVGTSNYLLLCNPKKICCNSSRTVVDLLFRLTQ